MNFRLVLDTRYCGEPFYSRTGDLLRIPQVDPSYRYPKCHSFSNRSIFADMLEQPSFESGLNFAPDVWHINNF